MSAVNLTKQTKALTHLDARRAASRGRDDARTGVPKAPRGKKETGRDLTPNLKLQDVRRSSAPSPSRASFIIGPGEKTPLGGTSPNPLPAACFGVEPTAWERKPRRRNSKHPDPILQNPRTVSSPIITLNRQHSDGLSYAQAAASMSTGSLQRTSITTAPEWAVQRKSPSAVSVSSRKSSAFPSPVMRKSDNIDTQSEAAASIFSDDEDHVTSDIDTDISTGSLDDLPSDLNRDERLIWPEKYYRELGNLEADVAGNSGLFLMKRENRQAYPDGTYTLKFGFHGHEETNQPTDYDAVVMAFCKKHSSSPKDLGAGQVASLARLSSSALAYWAFHVLECRNLMLQIKSNLAKMVTARYCDSSINILSVDPFRPNVARLTGIEIDTITQLCAALEECLEMTVAAFSKSPQTHGDIVMKLNDITQRSEAILDKLHVPRGDVSSTRGRIGVWRKTAMILDIGVISYCGAHIERFDETYLVEDLNAAKITAAWTYIVDGSEGIMLRRRSLRCLDEFLGSHQVWTFQSQFSWEDDQPLYLLTTIEEFADIWGPVWAAKQTEDSNTIVKYSTGSGSIIPWSHDSSNPVAEGDEVLCHWIRLGDTEGKLKTALQPDARLLIGASTEVEKRTSQLKINDACKNTSHRLIQQLRMTNMLEDLGTRAPTRVLAEETVSMSVGAYGYVMGGSKTYKRRSGVTLKDAICDAWKHSSVDRNPAILEHFLGLEVSLCSHNARRRRLKAIFNTPTMRSWLESCKTSATPLPCEKAFQEAIESRDPRAFRKLYKDNREWRRDLGQLVSLCLEGLRHSNVDQDRTLRALWMPQEHQRYRVKCRQNPHSWTELLMDSQSTCTFAVATEACLATDYKSGGRCQTKDASASNYRLPVLETALCVNRSAPLPRGLELRYSENKKQLNRWSISGLQAGKDFHLSTGRLIVLERFMHTRLVVEWETGVLKKLHEVKQSLGRSVGREALFHWELKGDEEDDLTEKPVPLFVRSRFAVRG